MKNPTLQSLISKFLLSYLPSQRGFSGNTVASYRDAIILLLVWFEDVKGTSADHIEMDDLTPKAIAQWLEWIGDARGCCPATCNIRLAAIKSFAGFVQYEAPEFLETCKAIASIPMKKHASREIEYLGPDAMGAIMKAAGDDLRELAILALLYDCAARVSEVCAMNICDVSSSRPFTARLYGKGRKVRIVPLSTQVGRVLSDYIGLYRKSSAPTDPLFVNASGSRIGRAGIAYILKKNVALAHEKDPLVVPETTHPHALRHSKSMHMLEAGINLVYIRDFLGHRSVTTTEIYAKASTEAKRKAIDSLGGNVLRQSHYDHDERQGILDWLRTLR